MRKKVVDTINEDLFKEVATGIYAISSKQIEVFPCVSRGEKYNTDSIIASEFNITHIPSVGVKSNYMIKCDGTGTEVVVGGYVFRVGVTRSVLDTQGIKAFGIKLVIPGTEVDNAQAILASIDDGSAKGLDTAEGYFYGLAFCKEEKPAGFNAYTGINETLPIVAVSGDYTSDHWTKISIGNTNRNVGTITSVNGKTPATTNGAVTIAASDISTNRADETVQTALTNLSTAVNTAQSTADNAYDLADNAIRIAKNKSTVSASTTSYTETGVNIAKSLLINGNKWNLPEGGGGTAGVSSIGGATGAITLGSGLSISGRTLSTSKTIPVVTLNGTVTANPGFFAPTTYGTKGQVLISGGTANPPTWQNFGNKVSSGKTFEATNGINAYATATISGVPFLKLPTTGGLFELNIFVESNSYKALMGNTEFTFMIELPAKTEVADNQYYISNAVGFLVSDDYIKYFNNTNYGGVAYLVGVKDTLQEELRLRIFTNSSSDAYSRKLGGEVISYRQIV